MFHLDYMEKLLLWPFIWFLVAIVVAVIGVAKIYGYDGKKT